MSKPLIVSIIGDFENRPSQIQTNAALAHAAQALSVKLEVEWLTTEFLGDSKPTAHLTKYHGIWAGPGNYCNLSGALSAIQFCREGIRPFLGT